MAETQGTNKSARGMVLGCAFIFFLAGAIILVLLGVLYVNNQRFLQTAAHTTGQIVDLVEDRGTNPFGSSIYTPVVEFSLGGQTYRFSSAYSTGIEHEIGQQVEIFYDPAKPTSAELADRTNLLTNPLWIAFGVAGSLLALFGLNALIRTLREQ